MNSGGRSGVETVYFSRETIDDDYFGSDPFGTILSPDTDADWSWDTIDDRSLKDRPASEILDIAADSFPDLSRAIYDLHQNIVTEWTWTATREDGEGEDPAGTEILRRAAEEMEILSGESMQIKIGKMVDSGYLKGAIYIENVFDDTRFIDIVVLDPFNVRFQKRKNDQRGQYWQMGQEKNGTFEPLESVFVRYIPLIPKGNKPFARPTVASAIYPMIFLLSLLKSARHSMHLQAFPNRLVTVDRKHLADAGYAVDAIDRIIVQLRSRLPSQMKSTNTGTQFLEGREVQMEMIGGVTRVSYDGLEMMIKILERQISRALKTNPLNSGIMEGSGLSSGNADQQVNQWEVSADSVKRKIEAVLSYFGDQILVNAGNFSKSVFQLKRNHSLGEKIRAERMDLKVQMLERASTIPIITPPEAREIFKSPDGLERLSEILSDDKDFEKYLEERKSQAGQMMNNGRPPNENENETAEEDEDESE